MTTDSLPSRRIRQALRTAFVADALAMPVHWFYNPGDIFRAFPGGVKAFKPAPSHHPSSIMSLHSTKQGGRQRGRSTAGKREIIGDVILKGRRRFWGQSNCHYHHGMQAGDNTLNAHCARVLMRTLENDCARYRKDHYLDAYIEFMTADPPRHNDTYAESCHRGFFANLEGGRPARDCGAVTHDTASIGGLVTIVPLVFALRLADVPLDVVQQHCREHLWLTHPDSTLAGICAAYVVLLDDLLRGDGPDAAREALVRCARESADASVVHLAEKSHSDFDVIGGIYSPACYISGAWPGVLYLALRYLDDSYAGLVANTNLGGDNVHRGFVLGTILGLVNDSAVNALHHQLRHGQELDREIDGLVSVARDAAGTQ